MDEEGFIKHLPRFETHNISDAKKKCEMFRQQYKICANGCHKTSRTHQIERIFPHHSKGIEKQTHILQNKQFISEKRKRIP